ncbi:unnamed protein product [marine sediment metagenome]|uniref:Uncharacterized protein n=1 Tax=marine sediment metagenome TaxID=412755 RepID=X1BV44_9ZZZZ
MNLLKNSKGQVSVEGITNGIIVAFIYFILAGTLWVVIDNELGDDMSNAPFGATGRTLMNVTVYLVFPAVIIGGATTMLSGRRREPPPPPAQYY